MQDKLPGIENTPAVAKPRRSRFSFSDVASSRVDAEGESGIEQLPEVTEGTENPPPLQVDNTTASDVPEALASAFDSIAFAEAEEEKTPRAATASDGAEGVASAFDSIAFAEAKEGKTPHAASEKTTQAAPAKDFQSQPSPSIPERRQHPRKQIFLFTYAVLGEENGGLVFNLSEGGLALTAAATLQEHHFSKMRVRFPDSADWFETSGQLAWKNDSGREAGIEFLSLPEDARARIGEWILQGDSAGDVSEDGIRARQHSVQELPSFMEPEESAAEPTEIPAFFEEQTLENQAFEEHRLEEQREAPAASSSPLFKTGVKGIFERTPVRRRVAKIKPPGVPDHSVRPRTQVARKALSIAAGVALAAGGWMFFQGNTLNEATNIIASNLTNIRHSHGPRRVPDTVKTDVGASETMAPPVQPKKSPTTQAGISTRSLQQIEKAATQNTSKAAATNPNSGSERTSKVKPHPKDALEQMAVESSPPRSPDRAQRPATSSQLEQETKSPQLNASAPTSASETKRAGNKPAESKPAQIAQDLPAQNRDLIAKSSSASANPSESPAAPPVVSEKEKPSVGAMEPEPVLARTPIVTVSFDPFPSILMPKTEKPKKSHQGKNLQMGRLVSRIDPVYPEVAKQQGVEGTVRVHAIFNREGAVQSVISVSGPPLLVVAAINAVRQWRYSQTILGGQAMETEEDVTVLFRLGNSSAKN